jgi:hypothetical protein
VTLTKAKFFRCDENGANTSESFYVQFNPNEITITEAVKNTPHNNKRSTRIQNANRPIEGAQSESLNELHISMRLFFNTYKGPQDYGDVRKHIKQFYAFSNTAATNNKIVNFLCFAWGTISVIGLLDSMSVSYTMFANDGTPVRAEAQISIRGRYNSISGSANSAKEDIVPDFGSISFAQALAIFGTTEAVKIAAREAGAVKLRI